MMHQMTTPPIQSTTSLKTIIHSSIPNSNQSQKTTKDYTPQETSKQELKNIVGSAI
jgi:hypothetical protein